MSNITKAYARGPVSNLERFVVDSTASRFTVKAFASGMSAALGHSPTMGIRDFDGEVRFVPDTMGSASSR
jgi:hypothetical protein